MPDNTSSLSVMAFDYGTKNIGVASANSQLAITSELPSLKARDGIPDWAQLEKLLQEYSVDLALVGLPLNMDDTSSELATRAKKFGNRLHGRFGIAVTMVDERLTTREAKEEAQFRGHKRNYKHDPVDSIAARLILEGWLAEQ